MGNPEQDARGEIDQLLVQAGWHVCDADQANITAYRGVAIREFPLPGHGFADYLLYKRVKANLDLSELPEGWVWASVDQLAAPEPNSITDGPFGSNLKTEHYQETGPRVIRLQNIKDGEFADEYAHISQEHFDRLNKHQIYAGDLVIASSGENPPRACIIPTSVGPAIVKADCIRFKPHSSMAAKFLNAALNCQPTRQRVKDVLHGIGRPRLSLGEIRCIALPVPPVAEQQRIAVEIDRRLPILQEAEAQVDANLRRAASLRSAILGDAFAGRTYAATYSGLRRNG